MAINLAIRFVLEVCALVSLFYWGFQSSQGILMKLGLGIGAPLPYRNYMGCVRFPKGPNIT